MKSELMSQTRGTSALGNSCHWVPSTVLFDVKCRKELSGLSLISLA